MTDFTALVTTSGVTPDPSKHVNFTQGMVLGADDFNQEFAYLSGRDQWLARDLIGYGVVCGLGVTLDTDGVGQPRVKVAPGVALSPHGELICVPATQCALLNSWLSAEQAQIAAGPRLTAYVVLCYRDCATDRVPIPGEPCRSEDALTAPSRVKDDFRLELRLRPPAQDEDDALRDFVAWLRLIPVLDAPPPGGFAEPEVFADELRQAAYLTGSPPSPPDFMYGSPPTALRIPAGRYAEYIRTAFAVWATDLRAFWRADRPGCCEPPDEGCLLLAALDIGLTGGAPPQVASQLTGGPDATPRVERRPFLVHLRMLQEWVLSGPAPGGGGGGGGGPLPPPGGAPPDIVFGAAGVAGTSTAYARADHIHGAPQAPQPGGTPGSITFGGPGAPGASPNFARADHTHSAPTLPALPAPGGTPTANAYGQPGAPGASAAYARADHVHSMPPAPAIPAPGGAPSPIAFGGGGSPGTLTSYARADHVHSAPVPPGGGRGQLVAAGRFNADGSVDTSTGAEFVTGKLEAIRLGADSTNYLLHFPDYTPETRYTVTGAPWVSFEAGDPHVFEYVGASADERNKAILDQLMAAGNVPALRDLLDQIGSIEKLGLIVRVRTITKKPPQLGFVVEVTEIEA